eukprot:3028097-Alexandrium_andersonii.AAC.1
MHAPSRGSIAPAAPRTLSSEATSSSPPSTTGTSHPPMPSHATAELSTAMAPCNAASHRRARETKRAIR